MIRDDETLAVFRFDEDLVQALANVADEDIPDISDEWGIDDGELLSELRALARMALARDEELFLYF